MDFDFFFLKKKEEEKKKSKINIFPLEVFSLFSGSHPHFPYTDLSNQKVNHKTNLLWQKSAKLCCKNVLKYQLQRFRRHRPLWIPTTGQNKIPLPYFKCLCQILLLCLSYKCHPLTVTNNAAHFQLCLVLTKKPRRQQRRDYFFQNSPPPRPPFANSWRVSNRSGSIAGPNRQERCKFGTTRHDQIYHTVKRGSSQSLGKQSALRCRPEKKKYLHRWAALSMPACR